VTHPHHPLVGQVVKVVRQLGQYPSYDERQWLIELPDQSRTSLPLSWAVEVDDTTQSEVSTGELAVESTWVDVASLLNLAKVTRHIIMAHDQEQITSEEEKESEKFVNGRQAAREQQISRDGDETAEQVGSTTGRAAARVSGDAGGGRSEAGTKAQSEGEGVKNEQT
jgi:hypothetical protein